MPSSQAALLDFVSGLYEFQTVARLTERICSGLPELLGAENAMICTHDGQNKVITAVVARHAFSRANLMPHINESGIMALHPFWPTVFDARQPVRALSDVVSRTHWHRNPLYAEVFRPDGIEDQLNVEILGDPDRFMTLNVLRSRRGFRLEDRQTFAALSTAVTRAFRNAQLAEQSGLVHAPAEGLFRLRVDVRGSVLPAGEDDGVYLCRYFGRKGLLPEKVRDWIAHSAVRLNQGVLENLVYPLVLKHAYREWVFTLHRDLQQGQYVLCARENRRNELESQLSEREKEVMRLVADGCENGRIAIALGLSPNTVKTHLKRIFVKLGARNRMEAVKQWRRLSLPPPCADLRNVT